MERATAPSGTVDKASLEDARRQRTQAIGDLQRKLYADDRFSVLFVFQAMDAGGKDSLLAHRAHVEGPIARY